MDHSTHFTAPLNGGSLSSSSSYEDLGQPLSARTSNAVDERVQEICQFGPAPYDPNWVLVGDVTTEVSAPVIVPMSLASPPLTPSSTGSPAMSQYGAASATSSVVAMTDPLDLLVQTLNDKLSTPMRLVDQDEETFFFAPTSFELGLEGRTIVPADETALLTQDDLYAIEGALLAYISPLLALDIRPHLEKLIVRDYNRSSEETAPEDHPRSVWGDLFYSPITIGELELPADSLDHSILSPYLRFIRKTGSLTRSVTISGQPGNTFDRASLTNLLSAVAKSPAVEVLQLPGVLLTPGQEDTGSWAQLSTDTPLTHLLIGNTPLANGDIIQLTNVVAVHPRLQEIMLADTAVHLDGFEALNEACQARGVALTLHM